jgi:hypothetical protein
MDQRDLRHDLPQAKVNAAVERGLSLCRHSVAPIVSLAQVVDELRADPNWTSGEVRQVEMALRKILVRVVSREPGTPGRQQQRK